MKTFRAVLALVAIVAVLALPIPTTAATAFYSATVSATTSASTVTPTAANGKPTSVVIQNDGAGDIFIDFDRAAVAAAATTVRLKACAQVTINFDNPQLSFAYLSVITASGTATARVTAHYMRGTPPEVPSTATRMEFAQNPNCSTLTTLPASGAAVASATALPVPTGRVFHVTGTTTITSVLATGIAAGTVVTIIFDGILTFTDGSNLVLAGDFVTTANDSITLAFDGTSWFETARSVN